MKTVGDKLEAFTVTAAKPGFNNHEENGVSAFEEITEQSFPGKWKIIYFYPKDFTFVCPTEIVEFAKLTKQFEERDAVLVREPLAPLDLVGDRRERRVADQRTIELDGYQHGPTPESA